MKDGMETVSTATDYSKALTKLLKKIGPAQVPDAPPAEDPIMVLVHSFLQWESTAEKARIAHEKIWAGIVDYNDLRVTLASEIGEMLGVRYPLVDERARRLRATLRDVYSRQHDLTLKPLLEKNKRDVKKYIESLDGAPSYVTARTMLIGFNIHAIPVDEQLRAALIKAGAADPAWDVNEVSNFLTRQIKAGDGLATHFALQAWVDAQPAAKSRSSRSGASGATRPRRKKTSSRTATG